MPNITGQITFKATMQTSVCLNDTPGHELVIRASSGPERSNDALFNNTVHSSYGTADLIRGSGQQHGYFVIEHHNNSRACGTYEGRISTVNEAVTVDGTWKYTHGTGEFEGISGNGTYKGRMTSPTELEASFEGSYQLKSGTRAA